MSAVRYLLDTNICIYIAKRRPPEVAARFERLSPGQVGMSMITYGELALNQRSCHQVQFEASAVSILVSCR